MSLIVQKFGGTSVADATKVKRAAERAVAAKRAGHQVVMVVSARGKKTDELVRLAAEITDTPPPREMDMLLSTGEQESVALMAMAVKELGEESVSLTGGQIGIVTDSSFTKARIQTISTERMRDALQAGTIVIACGFQGVDAEGNITTLGRGGSDSTAAALAAALHADECQIYTDVEGVFTTDPRMVPAARKIDHISYDEMLELASLGAGVMHSRSIEFAKKYHVPLRVRPAYSDGPGTLIAPHDSDAGLPVVAGVAYVKNEARVSLTDLPDRPGVMSLIFTKMSRRKIPIDMVVQDVSSGGRAEVTFTVPQDDLAEALAAASDAVTELGAGAVRHGVNLSKVSVVGSGMRNHTGVAGQMFQALAGQSVNIGMVTTSEIKISVLVDRDQCDLAVQTVHDAFSLDKAVAAPPSVGFGSRPAAKPQRNRGETEQDVIARLAAMEDIVVSEVALDSDQARLTVTRVPDAPGVAEELFTAVAEGGVLVDMIVQNVGHDGHTNVSFTVPRDDLEQCLLLVREVLADRPTTEIHCDSEIAKLTVMGIGLRSHTGVGQRMFATLSAADINVQMINTSEIRMSAVIAANRGEDALNALLETFGLNGHDDS